MSEHVRGFTLGAARITLIDVGKLWVGELRQHVEIPAADEEASRTAEASGQLDTPKALPMLLVHAALPDASVLIDAGFDDPSPASSFQPPESIRNVDLVESLAESGVKPEDVTHVVITHAHGDHYAGLTVERAGRLEPRFPNARVFVGRGDWEIARAKAASDPASLEARTFGVIDRLGRLIPVEEDTDIAAGARLIVTPGESPGHLVVRLSSEGRTLYCLGDLYHDTVEVAHPTWMFRDRDGEPMLASRARVAREALAEDALLTASHIEGIGRLANTGEGVAWLDVDTS
jgi:glyoxylase-like metal-dependent hydrolase (beta-lactamase superfamily II)